MLRLATDPSRSYPERSPRLPDCASAPWARPELIERLWQLHCRLVVELVAFELAAVEALEVRWQDNTSLDEQDDALPVERHGSTDLDKHVVVQLRVFIPVLVAILAFGTNVQNPGSAGAHVFEDLLWNRYGSRLALDRDKRFEVPERQQLLDLSNDC